MKPPYLARLYSFNRNQYSIEDYSRWRLECFALDRPLGYICEEAIVIVLREDTGDVGYSPTQIVVSEFGIGVVFQAMFVGIEE